MIQERPHNGNQLHQPKMHAFYMSTINIVCSTLHVLFFSLTEQDVALNLKCLMFYSMSFFHSYGDVTNCKMYDIARCLSYGVCLSYHACSVFAVSSTGVLNFTINRAKYTPFYISPLLSMICSVKGEGG